MKYKIIKLGSLSGNSASIYALLDVEKQKTSFEIFLEENKSLFLSELKDINSRLRTIGHKTGAREQFFKLDEGFPGDGVCALYDNPDSNLRLYCIRYGASLVVLGGGGHKPKSIRKLQQDPKLKEENYFLRKLSALITTRIKEGEIKYTNEGKDLEGNLEFNEGDYE
ncbi:MAG: hypothetical protein PHD06_10155 [Bacteroidales bacterium]|jgi:hypothetical protein|nr:hypothetical protein [Bacteroidales bacterium]